MDPVFLLLLAATITTLFLAFFYYFVVQARNRGITKQEIQLGKLHQDFCTLNNSVNVLRELSSQYFVTLQENGFDQLCKIETAMAAAIDLCEQLVINNDFVRADQILDYLYIKRGAGSPPPILIERIDSHAAPLDQWGEKSRVLLINLVESVRKSSEGFKQIGTAARRMRKNTTLRLEQISGSVDSLR